MRAAKLALALACGLGAGALPGQPEALSAMGSGGPALPAHTQTR